MNSRKITEAMYEAYTAGEKDYSALVSKMKAANIDLIYVGGYHTEAGLIMRQAREQGLKATLMSGDALVTEEYWAITGEAGEGTLMTFSPDPARNPQASPSSINSSSRATNRKAIHSTPTPPYGRSRNRCPGQILRRQIFPKPCTAVSSTPCSARFASTRKAT
ncbi:MAG: ABC transporter substrate-binding protein [Gammaproteobacteria bacterium]